MLQHAMQHCGTGTLHHVAAYCTMPWHKKQHHGTKHNAVVQRKLHSWYITNAMAHKKRHGTKHNATAQKAAHGKMLQQIMEGHGTKHDAMALITLPQNKAHCHRTKHIAVTQSTLLQHKKIATAEKSHHRTKKLPWHKKLCSGTKRNAAAHKTVLRHKNSTTECHGCMHKAMAKKPQKPKTTTTTEAATQVDCFFHLKKESYNLCKKHNNQQGHNDRHYTTAVANATQVDCFLPPPP